MAQKLYVVCSRCHGQNDAASGNWCKACKREYFRLNRDRYLASRYARQRKLTKLARTTPLEAKKTLAASHYLGASSGWTYQDEHGVIVFHHPTSRFLPQARWLELARWLITSKEKNAGSRQWAAVKPWLTRSFSKVTTIVSYSDPSVGHTGALYRACGWLWAPTYLRLCPSTTKPVREGRRSESVKDRWIYPLRPDEARESILKFSSTWAAKKYAWAQYREPSKCHLGGGDYKRFVHEVLHANV